MRVYISHPIRGREGKDATKEQMQANNDIAHVITQNLREKFPKIDFYCPGEHDEFVLLAYKKGYLNETEILDCDCEIVSTCDFVIAYIPEGYVSKGMQIEARYATVRGIPVFYINDSSEAEIILIRRHLETLLKG